MPALILDPRQTALVLIDLQNMIVARDTAPYKAADVVRNCRTMAEAFRARGCPVVYVRVDFAHMLQLPADEPMRGAGSAPPPPEAMEFAPAAGVQPGDIIVSKPHWGAFAGTDLEQQLRSRGVDTIVLAGIATNIGVESTARQGAGLGFGFVLVEDACATFSAEMQEFAFKYIFPRISRVRSTADVLAAFA